MNKVNSNHRVKMYDGGSYWLIFGRGIWFFFLYVLVRAYRDVEGEEYNLARGKKRMRVIRVVGVVVGVSFETNMTRAQAVSLIF